MEAKVHVFDRRDSRLDSAHFRELYDQLPDAALVLEPRTGIVIMANRALHDILGYQPDTLLGRSIASFTSPELRERESDVWNSIVRGSRLRDADVTLTDRDGREIEVSVSTSVVRDRCRTVVSHVAVFRDISRRRGVEREMLADHGHLRALAYELSVAEERERKRIASGLHDEIGQVLAIAKLKLGELERSRKDSPESAVIEDIHDLLDEASRAARTATFDLSCPVLQQLGLEAAIENLGSRMRRTSGLQVSFFSDGTSLPFANETLAVLYRAIRELLFNVDKHAQARSAEVRIYRDGVRLFIGIEDDGSGFDPGELPVRLTPKGGFGLFSIRAQMRGIGGSIDIDSSPGAGTRVALSVPLDNAPVN